MISLTSFLKETLHRYQNHYFGHYSWNNFLELKLNTPDKVSEAIIELLESDNPCMISRFGQTELCCMLYYIKGHHPFWFMRRIFPFWASSYIGENMSQCAGFFPIDNNHLCDFSDLLIQSGHQVDLLGACWGQEDKIKNWFEYDRCPLFYLEPYWSSKPWTKCLEGKKILVVHPFAESIKEQYKKREFLFDNPNVLPKFNSLTVIKAIQSLGGDSNGFKTWFDALRYMEQQIDNIDYDVALIGCGAYGMPLAAHCKENGKKAVHLGGALQLLFGIYGNRWEQDGYCSELGLDYKRLVSNPYWVKPSNADRPQCADKVEGGCYW